MISVITQQAGIQTIVKTKVLTEQAMPIMPIMQIMQTMQAMPIMQTMLEIAEMQRILLDSVRN